MITKDHPEWPEFRRELEKSIAELGRELESPLLTHEQTAAIRGEIAAYRKLIARIEPETVSAPARSYTSRTSGP